MDIKLKAFPYTVKAENKTAKSSGKEYLSIGVAQSKKNQSGEYETTWFNMIDKRDLLVLSKALGDAYTEILKAENAEYKPATQQSPNDGFDSSSEIPF